MKVISAKTVRFKSLVEKLGKPVPVTLWTKPHEDADFMRAVKQQRVMTIFQQNVGTKKDSGIPEFVERPGAAYLIFPKVLPYGSETKIVGIDYDLLASSPAKGQVWKPSPKTKTQQRAATPKSVAHILVAKRKEIPARQKPAATSATPKLVPLKEFEAEAHLVATQTFTLRATAPTLEEARKLLEAQMKVLSLSQPGDVKRKLSKIKQPPGDSKS